MYKVYDPQGVRRCFENFLQQGVFRKYSIIVGILAIPPI